PMLWQPMAVRSRAMYSAKEIHIDKACGFFTRSSANLLAAAKAAGGGHYVALSIVRGRWPARERPHACKGVAGEDDRRCVDRRPRYRSPTPDRSPRRGQSAQRDVMSPVAQLAQQHTDREQMTHRRWRVRQNCCH